MNSSKTRQQALANSPKTFLERDNWMRAVLASDLPDAAVRVAMTMALHLHVNSGRCNPSYPMLSAESHVAERSTYRLIDLLERRGWIAVTRISGRGNHYALLSPDTAMAVVTPDAAMAGVTDNTPDTTLAGVPLPNQAPTPANMLAGEKRRTAKKERKGKNIYPPPDDGSPGEAKKGPAAERKPAEADSARLELAESAAPPPENPDSPPPDSDDDELRASFSQFKTAYPRPDGLEDDESWIEYRRAVQRGADPAIINNRAEVYAIAEQRRIERSKDPEAQRKFTLLARNWLRKKRYADPPPDGAVVDEAGLIVEIEQDDGGGMNSRDAAYLRFVAQAGGPSW